VTAEDARDVARAGGRVVSTPGAIPRRSTGTADIVGYVALTVGWTWSFWSALAALPDLPAPGPLLLHLTGGLGPLVGAAWVLRGRDRAFRRRFLRRVVDPRGIGTAWWVALAAVMALPGVLGATTAALLGVTATHADRAPMAVAAVLAFAMAAGLVEEPGWRGAAMDAWPAPVRAVWMALGIGVVWTLWHLPLYLVEGSYQHGLGFGSVRFWLTSLALIELAVLYVWLVQGSGGSILLAVLAHAGFNAVGELVPRSTTGDVIAFLVLTALTLWVVARTRGHLGADPERGAVRVPVGAAGR
jgi:uncharacterized protein